MEQTLEERNKQLALKAFDTLFNRHDYDAAAPMWSEGYIQHSTHIGPGRKGLFERVRSFPATFRLKPLLMGVGVYPIPLGNQGIAVVDVRDIAKAAAISLTEEGHAGKTYDLVSSEMLSGPGAAAIWSRLLGKNVKSAGHADFDAFEDQLRKMGNPSWLAYDLRVMYQGYVERGFTHTESLTARIAALLGREPGKYSSYAEELMKQWMSQAEAA